MSKDQTTRMLDAEDDLIAFDAYDQMPHDELLARTKDLHRSIRIALGYRQMTHVFAALREGLKLP
jgi:hypothetical protein